MMLRLLCFHHLKNIADSLRCLSSSSRLNFDQDSHVVRIKTCKRVYSERNGPSYLFRNCPKEGIEIEVKYYDSNPTATPSTPVVGAFHGVPGSFQVFAGIIPDLRAKGFRVIAPNFPGNVRF